MPPAGSRIPPRFGKFGRHPENADKDEYDEDQEPSKAASYEELRRLHRARQMQGPRRLTKPKQEVRFTLVRFGKIYFQVK